MSLSEPQRAELLAWARTCIAAHLEQAPAPEPPAGVVALGAGSAGAFVTLRTEAGALRGCIGTFESPATLGRLVASAARSAAASDPRFPPVSVGELAATRIEVSLLTPLEAATVDQIELGRHGVSLRAEGHSALFLPQVAGEQGWDRPTLLSRLCQKAGLPADRWRRPGCELRRFEAEVFGEAFSEPVR